MTYLIACRNEETGKFELTGEPYNEESEALRWLGNLAFSYGPQNVTLLVVVPTTINVEAQIHPAVVKTWEAQKVRLEEPSP